jgi:hypothetical protein
LLFNAEIDDFACAFVAQISDALLIPLAYFIYAVAIRLARKLADGCRSSGLL